MDQQFLEIGRVKAIYRYPVKSMRGESLAEAGLGWYGLDGDRRFAFIRGDQVNSGFPWLTGRQIPEMIQYRARFTDPSDLLNSGVEVVTPRGRVLAVDSRELLQELTYGYGREVQFLKLKRGLFDSLPLSLMSTATADALSQATGQPVDVRRFRQNIILETFSGQPFAEEGWLDGVLTFGGRPDAPRIRLNRRIERCTMITLDPDNSQKRPDLLRHIAQTRANCIGIHATPERLGTLRVGDTVKLWL
ncbi:MAG: MOSC domain-containing protein [Anaerolineae bacterium]|nr:MOSC domain-containing protein [Anaerolineae bacterium]